MFPQNLVVELTRKLDQKYKRDERCCRARQYNKFESNSSTLTSMIMKSAQVEPVLFTLPQPFNRCTGWYRGEAELRALLKMQASELEIDQSDLEILSGPITRA
jgi:hypothetical protein